MSRAFIARYIRFIFRLDEIAAKQPKGVILSGGPSSVTDEDAPRVIRIFIEKINVPILGICYGMQLDRGRSRRSDRAGDAA